MNLSRVLAVVLRQAYLIRGSLARLLPMFAWVAIDIVLWGFITRYLSTIAEPGFNFVTGLLGAVLLWDFFTRVMHGVTTAFFEDVWSRNFLNFFGAPLTIAEYLTGLVVTSVTTSLVGLVVMLALAGVVFGLSFAVYGLTLVPLVLALFLFGIAMGIAGCALVLRMGPAAEWLVWPVPALLSPFAAVFYPLDVLPTWMQWMAHAMPAAHVFEAMRSIVAGETVSVWPLLIAPALASLYVLLACGYFTAVYRRAVRTGLLARYSAESVG